MEDYNVCLYGRDKDEVREEESQSSMPRLHRTYCAEPSIINAVFHAFSMILQLCGAWCTMSILIILEYRYTVLFYFIKYGRGKLCKLARFAGLYETNMGTSNFTTLQLPVIRPVDT